MSRKQKGARMSMEQMRFVIIGLAGSGKSALANAILERRLMFGRVDTDAVESSNGKYKVVDTPGMDRVSKTPTQVGVKQVASWKTLVHDRPDAILLTIRRDQPFPKEAYECYDTIKRLWGESFTDLLVVVNTFSDKTPPRATKTTQDYLQHVMKDASGRNAPFNAKESDSVKQKKMIEAIIRKVPSSAFAQPEFDEGYKAAAAGASPQLSLSASSSGRRIIIIGKTGNGKSSLGNTLLGADRFMVGVGLYSATRTAVFAQAKTTDGTLTVVDTPDIDNLNFSDTQAAREVECWKSLTSPEPDAILIAVRCDVRYTAEEHAIYRRIKDLWGPYSLCRKLIVAFTFGDRQDRDLEQELKTVCPELQSVLRDAEGRYVLFKNLASQTSKRTSVQKLLSLIDKMKLSTSLPASGTPGVYSNSYSTYQTRTSHR